MAMFAFTQTWDIRVISPGHGRPPQKPSDNEHRPENFMCLRCGEERTPHHAPWRQCHRQCMHCETFNHFGTECPTVSEAFYKPSSGSNQPCITQVDLSKRFWKAQEELRQATLDNQRMAEEIDDLEQKVQAVRDTEMENQALRNRVEELTRELGHVRRERDYASYLSNEASNLHVAALHGHSILEARVAKSIAILSGTDDLSQDETVPDPDHGNKLQAGNTNTSSTEHFMPTKSQVPLPTAFLCLPMPSEQIKPRVRLPGMPLRPLTPSSPAPTERHPDYRHSLPADICASNLGQSGTLYPYIYGYAPDVPHASRTTWPAYATHGTKREISKDVGHLQTSKRMRSKT